MNVTMKKDQCCDRRRLPEAVASLSGEQSPGPALLVELPARLIVCESSGLWALALRRELALCSEWSRLEKTLGNRMLEETRSVAECWQRLGNAPAGFVVVELTPVNIDPLLKHLELMEWRFPLARVAVVARPWLFGREDFLCYEWPLREAGAVFFAATLRSEGAQGVKALAGLACRHLKQSPRPLLTTAQKIWAGLPWKR